MIVAAVVNVVHLLKTNGYLPQPFIWDTRDTFMDWYNTTYWAHNAGAYSNWGSVYPPLSFVFLRLFSNPACYHTEAPSARQCDVLGITSIISFYVVGMVLAYVVFRRRHKPTASIRAAALALSYPGLFALERGNLLIPCFVFFVLANGDLVRARWARALATAMTINFKPYLVLPVIGLAIKRQWRMFELTGLASVGLYLVTYGLFGAGSPGDIVANTRNWIEVTASSFIGEIYQTTSFNGFFGVLDHGFPILNFTDSQTLSSWILRVKVLMLVTQVVAALAILGAWLQPKALPLARVSLLLFVLFLTAQSPGGYIEIFVVFLVFLEPFERPGQIAAIVLAYLICLPYDYVFAQMPNIRADSWLTGRAIVGHFGIAVGQFLRPAGLLLLLLSLSIDSIVEIVRAHRSTRPLLQLRFPALPKLARAQS